MKRAQPVQLDGVPRRMTESLIDNHWAWNFEGWRDEWRGNRKGVGVTVAVHIYLDSMEVVFLWFIKY